MKTTDLVAGRIYLAKVNRQWQPVQLHRIETVEGRRMMYGRPIKSCTRFHATNLNTGRGVTFRSARKFLREVVSLAVVRPADAAVYLDRPEPKYAKE